MNYLLILMLLMQVPITEDTINSGFTVKWIYETESGGDFSTAPNISPDGTIYIGSFDGYLYALTQEGRLKWKFQTGTKPFKKKVAYPSIDPDSNIYLTSFDGNLYVISPRGKLLLKHWTGILYPTSPLLDSYGNIYYGAHHSYLFSLSPDGEFEWNYKVGDNARIPAIDNNGNVYFGSLDSYLYSLTSEGKFRWRYKTEDEIWAQPIIDSNGSVYFGSLDGYFYALTSRGKLKWRYKASDPIDYRARFNPEGNIIFADYYCIYSLTSNGRLNWKLEHEADIGARIEVGPDGSVYFGSSDDYLYALTPHGLESWRFKAVGGNVECPKLDSNGTIYFTSDSLLYAIELEAVEPVASLHKDEYQSVPELAPVVTGGSGLTRIRDARTPEVNTWTIGTSFAGDLQGANHMNDWAITTWENAVFRAFVAWVPFEKLEVNAAAGIGYTYLADTGDLEKTVGLWDGEIGAAYEFTRSPGINLGTNARVFIPLRDSAFGGPRLGGSLKLLTSIPFKKLQGLNLHANLGTEYLEDIGLTWGIGVEYHLAILNPYLEFTGEVSADGSPIRVTPGFRIITDFGLSAYYAADFGLNLAARSIDLRGRDYVDQISSGIAFSY
ncbi:PQQ-binding-like beta-propeller repeat protein [candidate division WOR-3 bacterium]|uniref:PQQ-binding-like beta-propeller repeat protein n=1 Tax=candidate division WOR-3 bacterium TaxID=2052148 RepID=A0A9D5KA57_UNCW3|nr:PQQ-binding-like beta-propeller repeat protein [candidate division WOR-3 bacterium]MBD3365087.1 PQQ-binding-like beta-propeller repeat protein [candidate division WOR-3 bacterium]